MKIEDPRQLAKLRNFVEESNMIEGVFDSTEIELSFTKTLVLLEQPILNSEDICRFNTSGILREREGMNVWVGSHYPPQGGIQIVKSLNKIMVGVNINGKDPYDTHHEFETLHPFTDGNGRTGRALWLWQMVNQQGYNMLNGFLQQWYYQSLDVSPWRD